MKKLLFTFSICAIAACGNHKGGSSLQGSADQNGAGTTLSPISGANNQDQISQALQQGGTVTLTPGVYVISDTIQLASDVTMVGQSGAVIKLVDNANWPKHVPMLAGDQVQNLRISGFEIDGNRDNNGDGIKCGQYYYDMIQLKGGENVEVDNMYLHDNWNDIFNFSKTRNVKFHDNKVDQPGHDIVYGTKGADTWVYNNDLRLACNSGVRAYASKNMQIYNNEIQRAEGAGGFAAIEAQKGATVWYCNNNIHDVKTEVADVDGDAELHDSSCTQPDF